MRGAIGYILLFFVPALLQVLLFNYLKVSIYIYPVFYIVFIAMLPSRTPQWAVLLLALANGAMVDLLSGMAGLNVIAAVATAFIRPLLLTLIFGAAEVKEGLTPLPSRVGRGKAFRYILLVVAFYCAVYFTFEAMTFSSFTFLLLRIAASAAVSAALIYLTVLMLIRR